jgi:hypothetical protein
MESVIFSRANGDKYNIILPSTFHYLRPQGVLDVRTGFFSLSRRWDSIILQDLLDFPVRHVPELSLQVSDRVGFERFLVSLDLFFFLIHNDLLSRSFQEKVRLNASWVEAPPMPFCSSHCGNTE